VGKMKKLTGKTQIEMASRFFEIKEEMKKLKRLETDLKNRLMELSDGEELVQAGDYEIQITDYIQFRFDKKALIEQHGEDFAAAFEKETHCQKLTIKKV
jgi:predicted phage-related endonuclease